MAMHGTRNVGGRPARWKNKSRKKTASIPVDHWELMLTALKLIDDQDPRILKLLKPPTA